MFPYTSDIKAITTKHVETVVLLSGEKVDRHTGIDLDVEKLEGKPKVPTCPTDKEEAIMDAFRHVNLA